MAAITEWDFLNSNGGDDFVEVYLAPGESAADFTFSTYQRDGDLQVEIALTDVADVTTLPDGSQIFIIRGSDLGFGTFWLDGLGTGSNNVNSAALVNTGGPTNEVVDFYTTDRDPASAAITPTQGAAAGATSTALESEGLSRQSYNWDVNGENQFLAAQNAGEVVCFTTGTLMETPTGMVPVERLRAGDMISTVDAGAQPIVWVGQRRLKPKDLSDNPHWRPVRIPRGALGRGLPNRDLVVSPEHRLVMRGRAGLLFGDEEVLVAARHLIGLSGVAWADDVIEVTYYHVMCAHHQIVMAEGCAVETLHPNAHVLTRGDRAARDELLALFPELDAEKPAPALARRGLRRDEANLLVIAQGGRRDMTASRL